VRKLGIELSQNF